MLESTAPIVRRIFDLRCQGYSHRKIATAEQIKRAQTTMAAIEKRLVELGKLPQAIYKEKVMGRIPEIVCVLYVRFSFW